MVLRSWWKISENGDRGSTQNFAARLMSIVVCSGEPFLKNMFKIKKYTLFENGDILKIQKSRNKSPCGSFPHRGYLFRIYLQGGKSTNMRYGDFDFAQLHFWDSNFWWYSNLQYCRDLEHILKGVLGLGLLVDVDRIAPLEMSKW